jgi:hypothetical protein
VLEFFVFVVGKYPDFRELDVDSMLRAKIYT